MPDPDPSPLQLRSRPFPMPRDTDPDRGILLEPWISTLRRLIPAARDEGDPEAIHRLRTTLARLEAGALLLARAPVRRELRRLRRRASGVRDLDVVLAAGPPPGTARRCRKQRERRHRRLQRDLDGARCAALLDTLEALPAIDPTGAWAVVARLADRAGRDARRARRHAGDLALLHAARSSLRRLRYALDWLGRPSDDLARAQASIGAVRDHAIARRAARRGRRWRRGLGRARRRAERRVRRQWAALLPVLDSFL